MAILEAQSHPPELLQTAYQSTWWRLMTAGSSQVEPRHFPSLGNEPPSSAASHRLRLVARRIHLRRGLSEDASSIPSDATGLLFVIIRSQLTLRSLVSAASVIV